MMIVQPIAVTTKQQNQVNRECLYAWYPETVTATIMEPRDIYIHNGIDKDLLVQNPQTNGVTSAYNNSDTSVELLQQHKQSISPSDSAYHSAETIDEALRTPWALHYEIKRRPATPNLPSNSADMPINEEPPRRLKSAPPIRSLPPTAILNIPEPRFLNPVIPITTTYPVPPSASRPKTRASSAKARINTPVSNEVNQPHREIKSAQISRQKGETKKLSDEEIQQIFKRVYGDTIEQPKQQQKQPVQIIYTQPNPSTVPPPPVYVYKKSASWCADEVPPSPVRNKIEVSAVQLNPYYIHRPGVIAVRNIEKKSVVRGTSASRKATKRHRKRNEPLLALTPMPQKTKLSLEIDGVQLAYDPRLTLNDKSSNLTKYFIDGRLYLIKEQRYNVLDNIDPSLLNRNPSPPQRPKYYQTIPIEKFQIPKSSPELHYNASETYVYNTSPKRVQRYVIDPNLISENLNVNKMSLSKRPATATVYA